MALTDRQKRARNAAYQARWRERRAGLVAQAIIEGDSDRVIVRKIIEAVGPERTRGIGKRMNSLIERPGWGKPPRSPPRPVLKTLMISQGAH